MLQHASVFLSAVRWQSNSYLMFSIHRFCLFSFLSRNPISWRVLNSTDFINSIKNARNFSPAFCAREWACAAKTGTAACITGLVLSSQARTIRRMKTLPTSVQKCSLIGWKSSLMEFGFNYPWQTSSVRVAGANPRIRSGVVLGSLELLMGLDTSFRENRNKFPGHRTPKANSASRESLIILPRERDSPFFFQPHGIYRVVLKAGVERRQRRG